jgi:hypothetical protein
MALIQIRLSDWSRSHRYNLFVAKMAHSFVSILVRITKHIPALKLSARPDVVHPREHERPSACPDRYPAPDTQVCGNTSMAEE